WERLTAMEEIKSPPGGPDDGGFTASPAPGRPRRARTDPFVYGVTAAVSTAFVLWGVIWTDHLASTAQSALDWLLANVGWLLVLRSEERRVGKECRSRWSADP